MVQSREVVITGVGVVSPIGIGRQAFWESLLAGRSGVDRLDFAVDSGLRSEIGALIKDFEPKKYVKPRKSLKLMCREIQTGYSAATLAMEDAGLEKGQVESERIGVVMGSEVFASDIYEMADAYRKCMIDGRLEPDLWGEGAMSDLNPLWMLKYLPNMVACHIAIAYDAHGPNNTITLGEASSLQAVIEGVNAIERGLTDVMILGGVGTLGNVNNLAYRHDEEMSSHNDDPQGASRPFDAKRNGYVPGEGAAAMVFETREHAEARGANILAKFAGYGRTFENESLKSGTPIRSGACGTTTEAIQRSVRSALQVAELEAADLGCVTAHGASQVERDKVEAQAIRSELGDVAVTAPTSYFGNLSAGTGAVNLASGVLTLANQQVPATLNYEHPDPECPVNVVQGKTTQLNKPSTLVLSQSASGQAASILLTA